MHNKTIHGLVGGCNLHTACCHSPVTLADRHSKTIHWWAWSTQHAPPTGLVTHTHRHSLQTDTPKWPGGRGLHVSSQRPCHTQRQTLWDCTQPGGHGLNMSSQWPSLTAWWTWSTCVQPKALSHSKTDTLRLHTAWWAWSKYVQPMALSHSKTDTLRLHTAWWAWSTHVQPTSLVTQRHSETAHSLVGMVYTCPAY